ncbi:S-adenosylmethionine-dependent methyltransferase [Nitzschia inconspicua]|uniref:S-adenosylmethionine-dependent methyltransferase n=1 Tax=Nitzschia inconspicua TaxID=303405 RepID=A0A9K3LPR0_9STRA|nr:S-adenosylmethionine-dependent methyltransferase [Nitzschia inconspicua]
MTDRHGLVTSLPHLVLHTQSRSFSVAVATLFLVLVPNELDVVDGLLFHGHASARSHSQLQVSRDVMSPFASSFENEMSPVDGGIPIRSFPPLEQAIKTAVLDNQEANRVFHGRGGLFDGCEHITLDWFPPVWLLTSHHIKVFPSELAQIQQHLQQQFRLDDVSPPINFVYQHRSINSTASTQVLCGSVPEPHVITENGMKFYISLLQGQNQGIFLDMRNGRDWVRRNASGKIVLNLFAYTCGFSIAALMGGATEVINMDMARGCLKMGQRNHELNDVSDGSRARFFAHDIFKSWGKIRKLGPYGMIVVDPPSYQKGSFVAKDDYRKIIKRLPGFLEDNGLVMLCLNAPELDSAWLQEEVTQAAPELTLAERLASPSNFPAKDSERALKVLVYKKSPKNCE